MNIVLIPTWDRDDFLKVMIDYIKDADGAYDNHYVFLIDQKSYGPKVKYNENIPKIIESCGLHHEIKFNMPNSFSGNSMNLLEGYKYAYQSLVKKFGAELVYLLEEDIFIGKDFFNYHEIVQNEFDEFCVSGVYCQNLQYEEGNNNDLFKMSKYQSLGVSYKVKNLPLIVEHSKPAYYGNLSRYCMDKFPSSRLHKDCVEQDGLIDRIIEKNKLSCIYPMKARAFHAGYHGYNRPGKKLKGSLEERSNQLKNMTEAQFNDSAVKLKDIRFCDFESHDVIGFNMLENVPLQTK